MTPIIIEQVLRDRLLTQNAVTALVGTGEAARIRPGELDQSDALPAVTIECDDEVRDVDLAGKSGWIEATIFITSHAGKYLTARHLNNAIAYNDTDPPTGLANVNESDLVVSYEGSKRLVIELKDGAGGKRTTIVGRYLVLYKEPH